MPTPFTLAVSPRLRTTPFHDRVLAAGAQAFSVYNHMLLPLVYESWEADYWHLMERVQLWDFSVERQVEIQGPRRARAGGADDAAGTSRGV